MGLLSYIPIVNRFLPQEEPQASAPVVESQSPFGDTVAAAPGSNGARGAVLNGASAAPPAGLAAAGAFGGELGQGPSTSPRPAGRSVRPPPGAAPPSAAARLAPQEPSWARWEDGLRDARPARRSWAGSGGATTTTTSTWRTGRSARAAAPLLRRRGRGYSEVGPPRYYEEDYGWDDRRGRPARRYDDDGYGYEPRPPFQLGCSAAAAAPRGEIVGDRAARFTMAVGKNKRLTKSKKGGKKKATDPFLKKEWYEIKAPSMFSQRNAGKTLVTRTQGTKIASDALKGRVFDLSPRGP
ncbi:hypothetical protein JL720_11709 [Aureococcus anophagefferens]|nr:hypothetical protein JL720_11709 [Aureococcus anophagefferens]